MLLTNYLQKTCKINSENSSICIMQSSYKNQSYKEVWRAEERPIEGWVMDGICARWANLNWLKINDGWEKYQRIMVRSAKSGTAFKRLKLNILWSVLLYKVFVYLIYKFWENIMDHLFTDRLCLFNTNVPHLAGFINFSPTPALSPITQHPGFHCNSGNFSIRSH